MNDFLGEKSFKHETHKGAILVLNYSDFLHQKISSAGTS